MSIDGKDRFVVFLEERIKLCKRICNYEAQEHYEYVLTAYKLQMKIEDTIENEENTLVDV